MLNISLDKTAIKDMILDAKGENTGAENQELHSSRRKLFNSNPSLR